MFTPARKSRLTSSPLGAAAIPNRPKTGTPAHPSLLTRILSGNKVEKTSDADQIQPVRVAEFPHTVRIAQANFLEKSAASNAVLVGGIDKGTSLSWMICGNQFYVWDYLSNSVSKQCVTIEIPSSAVGIGSYAAKSKHVCHYLVSLVNWDVQSSTSGNLLGVLGHINSVGVVLYNRKTHTIAYWPDIYSESGCSPIVSPLTLNFNEDDVPSNDKRKFSDPILESESKVAEHFTSLITAGIPGTSHECIAIGCKFNGEVWHFYLAPSGIRCENIFAKYPQINSEFARSVVWRSLSNLSEDACRQFCLLTDREIQCWEIVLASDVNAKRLWTHELVGSDDVLGIKKDLAGQKHIWLLDMQVDDHGKEFTVLVATLCKDRVSSSSYTQYSLLTMQYRPHTQTSGEAGLTNERVLEKKVPLQIIIPKARVENEDFLFSVRLRVGGKPSGSAIILSGDGTATVTYWKGSTRLYQFDLPWDAGKVSDASVLPSADDEPEGKWIVLTEKAGVWAIPEKAVLLGGVEPPERSLSRKGSSNEGSAEEEKRSQAFGGNIVPRRASSEAWGVGDRHRAVLSGIAQRTAQDEEAEALVGRLFNDFLLSGDVEEASERLRSKGVFEKEGETNVFARLSKSIVDTLAKHWTTTRGADFVASAVISSLLLDKQQKHQKYIQFLALSKCHEVLFSRQRIALLSIMEHGEKLSGMIQLREFQNLIIRNQSNKADSHPSHAHMQIPGSLWFLIQLVGERARRNNVLLMDRDNAEVFFSRVSDIEELFSCISSHLNLAIGEDQSSLTQMQRACEVSKACIALIQSAVHYRKSLQTWYPSLEGLTPWNCHLDIRYGLCNIASFIMELLKGNVIDPSVKSDLCTQLEGLTDALLEGYTGAILAKKERREEYRGLLEEYFQWRDELFGFLYDQAKRTVETRYQDSRVGAEDTSLKETIFREVMSSLLSFAKRYEGYSTLWRICYDLSDTELLRKLMHDIRGPKGGFSYFVFGQLIKSNKYAKLLRLGEEFQEELANFLKEKKELLWLHQIFLSRLSSASETLHALALSHDDGSELQNLEPGPCSTERTISLADRRRLLRLSKIAAFAGRDSGFERKVECIEANLRVLKLQDEIIRHFYLSERSLDTNKVFPPGDLIEMCLKEKIPELSLLAFEIFAWTSSFFRNSNRSLLAKCWMNAADQDDWIAICQSSITEGWTGELTKETLTKTALYKASKRCYGQEAESFDGCFEDVLPIQREDSDDATTPNHPCSSVHEVLLQHVYFADAGKLMLTAVMMGKLEPPVLAGEGMTLDCR